MPEGKAQLLEHQRWYVNKAREVSRYGIFAGTGTGKTLIGLTIAAEAGPKARTLVVAPLSLLETAWLEDRDRFTPSLPFWNLRKVKRPHWLDFISRHPGLYVVNYETFRTAVDVLAKVKWDVLVFDEASKLKNPYSQVSKAAKVFSAMVPRCYPMSGTPAPNTKLEYWPQGLLLDVKEWGRSYFSWRKRVAKQCGYFGKEWEVTPEGAAYIAESLKPYARHVNKEELFDLPERTYSDVHVELSRPEIDAYKAMRAHMVFQIESNGKLDEVSVNGVLPKLMKLRQITSGFAYNEIGDVVKIGDSKESTLLDVLYEIGPHQVIIWTHFLQEAQSIRDAIEKARKKGHKIGFTTEYHGMVPKKDRLPSLDRFKAGEAQYLIASPASIAHGVTLTNATYMVWYSLSASYEQYHQGGDRFHRLGQTKNTHIMHLIVPGTIDAVLHACLKAKKNLATELLSHLKGET